MTENERIFVELIKDGTLSIDSEGRMWRHYWIHPFAGRIALKQPRRAETSKAKYLRLSTFRNFKPIHAQAHRVIYIYNYGDIIDGLTIDHKDFNKHNNNPLNLEAITQYENTRRAKSAKRYNVPHKSSPRPGGECSPLSKLTNIQAAEIRNLCKIKSQLEVSKIYNVSRTTIQAIVNGRTYRK